MSNDPSNPTPPAHSPAQLTIGGGLLWALAGLILTPLVWVCVTLILNSFNPNCGLPGDSGGCAMTVVVGALYSALPGAALGFIVGAVRTTYWRRVR